MTSECSASAARKHMEILNHALGTFMDVMTSRHGPPWAPIVYDGPDVWKFPLGRIGGPQARVCLPLLRTDKNRFLDADDVVLLFRLVRYNTRQTIKVAHNENIPHKCN